MAVNILECRNIGFELVVSRYVSVWGDYIRGAGIKGRVCEKKLMELAII